MPHVFIILFFFKLLLCYFFLSAKSFLKMIKTLVTHDSLFICFIKVSLLTELYLTFDLHIKARLMFGSLDYKMVILGI